MEKPKGPTDMDCMFWQKPMSDVCHKCPMWTMVERTDPDGYKERNWSCGFAFMVPILTETLQEAASSSIEINKLRNSVVGVGTGMMQLARRGQDLKQIEDGQAVE